MSDSVRSAYTPLLSEPTPVPLHTRIIDLQEFQREHDLVYHKDIDCMSKPDQIRHITYHITKIAGIMADLCSAQLSGKSVDLIEPAMRAKRIPDLFVFTLKLANVCDIDLSRAFFLRHGIDTLCELATIQENVKKQPPSTNPNIVELTLELTSNTGRLADLCDKTDHGEPQTHIITEIRERCINDLLLISLLLAKTYSIDLANAYLERMRDVEKHRIL